MGARTRASPQMLNQNSFLLSVWSEALIEDQKRKKSFLKKSWGLEKGFNRFNPLLAKHSTVIYDHDFFVKIVQGKLERKGEGNER